MVLRPEGTGRMAARMDYHRDYLTTLYFPSEGQTTFEAGQHLNSVGEGKAVPMPERLSISEGLTSKPGPSWNTGMSAWAGSRVVAVGLFRAVAEGLRRLFGVQRALP
jgi:hypothetical protein